VAQGIAAKSLSCGSWSLNTVKSATVRADIDKKREDLSANEKLEYLRLNMAELRRSLLGYAADFDVSLRQLNERLVRIEETLKK
jgi:hypothetical protein